MGFQRPKRLPSALAGVSRLALAAALAAMLAGCAANRSDVTGSIPAAGQQLSDNEWRQRLDSLAGQYRSRPNDPNVAIAYARALRASDQRAHAAAVLQQASIRNPENQAVLGAYGRALADVGQYEQAMEVLGKAHTPDQPDWRLLNVQGAVLDKMGKQQEAQRYYQTALQIAPDEPAILSNLGLSYALSKDLKSAEATLRRAAANPRAEPRVRQNLGLVLALQSKFDEAERVTAGVLSPEEARANVALFREMMREPNRRRTTERPKPSGAG